MGDTGLYKYVYNGEIIYIGMSTRSILQRILDHEKEEKFKPFIKEVEIFVCYLEQDYEITFCERSLISKYKPLLNKDYVFSKQPQIDIEKIMPKWERFRYQYPIKGLFLPSKNQYQDYCNSICQINYIIAVLEKIYEEKDIAKSDTDIYVTYSQLIDGYDVKMPKSRRFLVVGKNEELAPREIKKRIRVLKGYRTKMLKQKDLYDKGGD